MQDENLMSKAMEKTAKIVSLSELSPASKVGEGMFDGNFSIVAGVKVNLEAVVGGAELSIQELFALQKGSIVELAQSHHAPLEIRLDGKLIALGSLVLVGENFGVSITEILSTTNEK